MMTIDQFSTTCVTNKNRVVILRLLSPEDVEESRRYINQISTEDTYIGFSGEQLTSEEEQKYIQDSVHAMTKGDSLHLVAEFEGRIVAMCDARRDLSLKKRSAHIAQFGLTVAQDFRGEGLGEAILSRTIALLPDYISGISVLKLGVFGPNQVAQSLYRKLGFQEYGRLPKGILYRDEFVDHVFMYKSI